MYIDTLYIIYQILSIANNIIIYNKHIVLSSNGTGQNSSPYFCHHVENDDQYTGETPKQSFKVKLYSKISRLFVSWKNQCLKYVGIWWKRPSRTRLVSVENFVRQSLKETVEVKKNYNMICYNIIKYLKKVRFNCFSSRFEAFEFISNRTKVGKCMDSG